MLAFSDCLWKGNLIFIYCDFLGKSWFPYYKHTLILATLPYIFFFTILIWIINKRKDGRKRKRRPISQNSSIGRKERERRIRIQRKKPDLPEEPEEPEKDYTDEYGDELLDYSEEKENPVLDVRSPKTNRNRRQRNRPLRKKPEEPEKDYSDEYGDDPLEYPEEEENPVLDRLPETNRNRRQKKRPLTSCKDDLDCFRGHYCAIDVEQCIKEQHLKFGDECDRTGGNFPKILHNW